MVSGFKCLATLLTVSQTQRINVAQMLSMETDIAGCGNYHTCFFSIVVIVGYRYFPRCTDSIADLPFQTLMQEQTQ